MLAIRVLEASIIDLEGWTEKILALDRENMSPVLERAGLEFPEETRRQGLMDASTVEIVLLDDGKLAGYVEFCKDWSCDRDIYLGSIQLRRQYRGGWAFAILLVECAKALETRNFCRLRAGVQKNNRTIVELYRKLGFKLSERPGSRASLDVTGSRDLLHTERLHRLEKAVEGRYRKSIATGRSNDLKDSAAEN